MAASRARAPAESAQSRDWLRQPVGILLFWWAIPIGLGISTNFLDLSPAQTALAWAGSFLWMGTGCTLNALRCGRRHCHVPDHVPWRGGIAAGLLALGIVPGRHALGEVVNGAAAPAALSWLSERIWGVYAGRK